jgi:hypothetical protein
MLAARDPVADHGELHDAEEHERADRRADAEVGEGEGRGVDEQRERSGEPRAAQRPPRAGLRQHEHGEHHRARREPQRGEAGRVELPTAQREPRQQRIRREGDEREQGEHDRAQGERRTRGHSANLASTRKRRSITSHSLYSPSATGSAGS